MRDIIKMGLILLLITSISGLLLGVTNSMTEGIILERAMAGDIASMQNLIADADTFDAVTGEGIDDAPLVQEVFAGKQGDEVVGYTIKVNPSGYGGAIEIMVGISTANDITGVEILSQTETPGLGSKVTEPEFREKFIGKSTTESTAVDAIAGATVSSDAVNHGVRTAVLLYEEVLKN
jgi:electron transport complex protein RnfG